MTKVEWSTSLKRSKKKTESYRRIANTLTWSAVVSFVAGVVFVVVSLLLLPFSLILLPAYLVFFLTGAYALMQAKKYREDPGLYATTNHFISREEKRHYVDEGRLESSIDYLFDKSGIEVIRKEKRYKRTEYVLEHGVRVQVACLPQDLTEYLLIIQILIQDEAQKEMAEKLKDVINELDFFKRGNQVP